MSDTRPLNILEFVMKSLVTSHLSQIVYKKRELVSYRIDFTDPNSFQFPRVDIWIFNFRIK